MFSWDFVTKLRDNPISKTLVSIKKSHKSTDFDLAKHILVFPTYLSLNYLSLFLLTKELWNNFNLIVYSQQT